MSFLSPNRNLRHSPRLTQPQRKTMEKLVASPPAMPRIGDLRRAVKADAFTMDLLENAAEMERRAFANPTPGAFDTIQWVRQLATDCMQDDQDRAERRAALQGGQL